MKTLALKIVLLMTTLLAGQASFAEFVKVDDKKIDDYVRAVKSLKPCSRYVITDKPEEVYVDKSGSQPALRFISERITYAGQNRVRLVIDFTTTPDKKGLLSVTYREETYLPVLKGNLTDDPSVTYQWFSNTLDYCEQK